MKATTSIKIAAGFNTLFFIFHIPFYWMLDWKHSLACLNNDNWAIFQCFNILTIALLCLFSYLTIFKTKEMVSSSIGKSILVYIAFFYTFRIVAEFIFFDITSVVSSAIIIGLCGITVFFNIYPVFKR